MRVNYGQIEPYELVSVKVSPESAVRLKHLSVEAELAVSDILKPVVEKWLKRKEKILIDI